LTVKQLVKTTVSGLFPWVMVCGTFAGWGLVLPRYPENGRWFQLEHENKGDNGMLQHHLPLLMTPKRTAPTEHLQGHKFPLSPFPYHNCLVLEPTDVASVITITLKTARP